MKKAAIALLCAVTAFTAQAVEISALPGGTVIAVPSSGVFGGGPLELAPGITWSSESSSSVFGWTAGYGFAGNGRWSGSDLSMVGSNSRTAAMTVAFNAPVSSIGAFLNYAPGMGEASIAVYDINKHLIESTVLDFSTGGAGNSGEFHGFSESSANISYFTMKGAYIGAANFSVSAVPEPETYGMLLAGLGLLGMVARRRKA